MTHCRCHCRRCGAHFSSLEGFDAHHGGEPCTFPDGPEFVELLGACAVAHPGEPARPAVVYRLVREGKYGAAGRQTPEGKLKEAVAA